MSTRVAINGFGRTGRRCVPRTSVAPIESAINDVADP